MIDGKHALIERFLAQNTTTALKDTPVVLVIGPRQCGKTTLVRQLITGKRDYFTLDDAATRAAALSDPTGFIRDLDHAIIDEVQHAPELLLAIKQTVDQDRRPGRFLLTGSANILSLPRTPDSLAGRMEIITLLPLSQAEIFGRRPAFIQKAFTGTLTKPTRTITGKALVRTILQGGYPEMLQRSTTARQAAWVNSYVKTTVQRDVREVSSIEKLEHMPKLLQSLAHHSGRLTNFTSIGGEINIDDKTTRAYTRVFEELFFLRRIEPWHNNRLSRLIKTPKLHFLDSGLLSHILKVNAARIAVDRSLFGPILETYIFSEILKQESWLEERCELSHYRDKEKNEVDLVLENAEGHTVGIEIKAAASVKATDFNGLRKLAHASKNFKLGVVLYDGERTLPFGDHLYAAPISSLWGT
jgi:hypothetical protein